MIALPGLLVVGLLSAFSTPAPWSEGGESRAEDLNVLLITFSPGAEIYSLWGHSALVVEDRRLRQSRLYNYGMFGNYDGFVTDFVKGRLKYWVEDEGVGRTVELYKYLQRDVRVQELDLEPSQRLVLAHALAKNVLPEHREYLYHHYFDNCSTRPRDIIDLALGGQLKAATAGPARMTLRAHTRRYSGANPPISVVLDYLQNDLLDTSTSTQQNEAFLPDELERQLGALRVTRSDGTTAPLVSRAYVLYDSKRPRPPETAPDFTPWLLALGLGLGGLSLALGQWGRGGARLPRVLLGSLTALLGLLCGVFGSFLFGIGTFTNHLVAHHNENLFLVNPLDLALLPLGLMLVFGSQRARRGLKWVWSALAATAALGVVLKVLPMFDQANWNLIALAAPVNVLGAATWWRLTRGAAAAAPLARPRAAQA